MICHREVKYRFNFIYPSPALSFCLRMCSSARIQCLSPLLFGPRLPPRRYPSWSSPSSTPHSPTLLAPGPDYPMSSSISPVDPPPHPLTPHYPTLCRNGPPPRPLAPPLYLGKSPPHPSTTSPSFPNLNYRRRLASVEDGGEGPALLLVLGTHRGGCRLVVPPRFAHHPTNLPPCLRERGVRGRSSGGV
jgi:hypothetical protein